MNLKDIKSQFPIFKSNKKLIYFDTANSAQKPIQVIDALENFYKNHYANTGRAVYGLAARSTADFESTRETIKEFVNGTEGEIVFTKNSTESLNLVAHCFGKLLKEGDEIILTEAEHHSNYVPWHFLRKKKVNIKFIPINEDGEIEVNKLTSLITNKTKIISVIHISNVTGLTTDIKKVISIAMNRPQATIVLAGRCASSEQISFPDSYSLQRAKGVKEYLVYQSISADRIKIEENKEIKEFVGVKIYFEE